MHLGISTDLTAVQVVIMRGATSRAGYVLLLQTPHIIIDFTVVHECINTAVYIPLNFILCRFGFVR